MRRLYALAGVAAMLALSGPVLAQGSGSKGKATTKAAAASAHGTLTAVDTAANSITLKSGKHEWTFSLAQDAVIHEGSKTITIADLAGHKGHDAKVHYTESAGSKVATSVMVAGSSKPAKPTN
jgi:hypothetical protein